MRKLYSEKREKIWAKSYERDLPTKADPLPKLVNNFSLVNILFITKNILNYPLPVTRKLQTKDPHIAQSFELIKSNKVTIEK